MSEIFQLLNQADWHNIHNGSFTASVAANGRKKGASVSFGANHRILCAGVLADVYEPEWWLGGIIDVGIEMSPSPTSSFIPFVEIYSQKLRINRLNLIILPQWISDMAPFIVTIRTARWISSGFIECDEYSGVDNDSVEVRLQALKTEIDSINSRIP
jgi:hypothetical protein